MVIKSTVIIIRRYHGINDNSGVNVNDEDNDTDQNKVLCNIRIFVLLISEGIVRKVLITNPIEL